jgi:flagellar M-ring protein FliF
MAASESKLFTTQFVGFTNLTAIRQLGLFIALAASVAVGVAIVMWSITPNMALLFSGLSEKDSGLVIGALQRQSVRYQLGGTGTVLVPSADVHNIRMQLASQGLPQGIASGFEMLDGPQGFGVSQFMETARFQRSLEVELSRSVMALANVQVARVHLAIPKQSASLRNRRKPSASVLVSLYSGRMLEEEQVMAITHIVSSSVPDLKVSNVTVVDQNGRLLTSKDNVDGISASQLKYTQNLEKSYISRIEGILVPIVGADAISAQVTAVVDFTVSEQTQELFTPDSSVLRSAEIMEEGTSANPQGVSEAASNQPGSKGKIVENASQAVNSRRRSTEKFELDKTISHTRFAMGNVKRLSVAVVIDDKKIISTDGTVSRSNYSPEEMERFTQLVKEAVGYTVQRGDSVKIINAAFSVPAEPEPLPEKSIWQQGWFSDVVKNVIGGVLVLVLLIGVLKPVMRSLTRIGKEGTNQEPAVTGMPGAAMAAGPQGASHLSAQHDSDNVTVVKTAAEQDPKLVAQVVKSWVSHE